LRRGTRQFLPIKKTPREAELLNVAFAIAVDSCHLQRRFPVFAAPRAVKTGFYRLVRALIGTDKSPIEDPEHRS